MPKITIPTTDGWNEAIDGWATITVKERGYEPTKIEVPGVAGTGSPTREAVAAVQAAYPNAKLRYIDDYHDRRSNPLDDEGRLILEPWQQEMANELRHLRDRVPLTEDQIARIHEAILIGPRERARRVFDDALAGPPPTRRSNPAVGFSWRSPKGRREITGMQEMPDGQQAYVVTTEGVRFASWLLPTQIESEIALDESNAAFHARQRAEQESREAATESYEALLTTFLATFDRPLARGKAEKALRVVERHGGQVAPRFKHIERLVREGWRVPEGIKQLRAPDGRRLLTQSDVTKTGLDYAQFLAAVE